MNGLTQASSYEVRKWIVETVPELTPYQLSKFDEEAVRLSRFYFYKRVKKTPFWWRLTAPFYCAVWIALFLGMPLNYLLTGRWGYNFNWFREWTYKL